MVRVLYAIQNGIAQFDGIISILRRRVTYVLNLNENHVVTEMFGTELL